MDYLYESIEHRANIPVKIFTQTVQEFPYHWHDDTEILFILRGEVEITIDNRTFLLKEGNIFIINRREFHLIKSTGESGPAQLMVLQIEMDYYSKFGLEPGELVFQLKYVREEGPGREAYNRLRGILASLMNIVINKEEPADLLMERHLLDLIIILTSHFTVPSLTPEEKKGEGRIMEIMAYVRENYNNPSIGVEQIADAFYLNAQYLSRHFKDKLGVSLKKFIDMTRLNKSLHTLKSTEERILDVALQFGFPDAKAYYRVFKEVMAMTPAQYREENRVSLSPRRQKDYFSINSRDTLSKLFKYLNQYVPGTRLENREINREETINLPTKGRPFKAVSHTIMTYGYAPHGLREDFQAQLRTIQKEMPFRYIRFHGIFSDQMLVCNRTSDGAIYYNFNHVDRLIDSLMELNLKPFLELGFMPSDLASRDKTIFWWKAHISPPGEQSEWNDLIDAFIRHLINRYGLEEIRTWYFEFWNEPEFSGIFWDGDMEEFFNFFHSTWKTIKNIDSEIRVGGFGNIYYQISREWLHSYRKMAAAEKLELDFFTFHVYQTHFPTESSSKDVFEKIEGFDDFNINWQSDFIRSEGIDARLGGPEFLKDNISSMISLVEELGISKEQYFITEWNANTDCRDLVHDSCYMAPFIVKNVLECHDKVRGMGFWTATDIHEEFRLPQPLFHGGFGLMTQNGLKKPAYHGFSFLSQLGNEILYQSENMVVTRRGEDYQILIYHYVHYNELYSRLDYSQISRTSRYEVFESDGLWQLRLYMKGLSGPYVMEKQRVNRSSGSSFDSWVKMGAPEVPSERAMAYLKKEAEPDVETEFLKVARELVINTEVEPHEIQLITLKRRY